MIEFFIGGKSGGTARVSTDYLLFGIKNGHWLQFATIFQCELDGSIKAG